MTAPTRRSLFLLPIMFGLLCATAVRASAENAEAILARVRHLGQTTRHWSDRVQRLHLRIIDRRGGERQRDLVIYLKKYPEDRTRTLVFFESPPDVKGVGMLQWADPHAQDQQWLYVPELKRVRKIGAGAKQESFAGTDFSFDDLAIMSQITDWTEADARSEFVGTESLDGQPCQVIQFTPHGKTLTYGRIVVWLRADDLVVLRYTMHDSAGRQQKVLSLSDLRPVGTIPSAFRMQMQNVGAGSRTVVDFTEIKYNVGLADDLFTQRALERGQ